MKQLPWRTPIQTAAFVLCLSVCLIASVCAADKVREQYQKLEYRIPMRDGVKLYTAVYVPRNVSSGKRYPFLMQRTCFGVTPYGPDQYKTALGPSPTLQADGYIFVYQDVRGRWASEGRWTNMTPVVSDRRKPSATRAIDESTDTYDTIEWLLRHVHYHNGRVGLWGMSYAGFYAMAGSINAHPALKASSPQAPIADFFREDIHHNGAFTQVALLAYPLFGDGPTGPTTKPWFFKDWIQTGKQTEFAWHQRLGPLANAKAYLARNVFWQQTVEHPNYDAFWQKRNILPHLRKIRPAVLVVGGWFDAEDLYGPLSIYKTLKQHSPQARPMLVMGPFGHRGWSEETGHTLHNDLYFGDSLATYYQRTLEAPFFHHYLKGAGDGNTGLPKICLFDTGKKNWRIFTNWPSSDSHRLRWYLTPTGQLTTQPAGTPGYREYVSDPANPVPYTEASLTAEPDFSALASYISADQRFAGERPDVLTFQTDVLTENLTVGGEITVRLKVSTTGTDADWVVKLIDVYPPNEPNHPYLPNSQTQLANYQQLVRADVIRGRFRDSFETPKSFTPNQITDVTFRLQDMLHTFKKGHRVMIQVQSSWFPLIDRNPQTYVENIYKAQPVDFQSARHRLFSDSSIEVMILP
ncbi:CocE/NonD family hydrolase [Spirosoma sp. HMF4905]|uniref:CocE/NonD family hydrolase n=1 Tax=Spirosoma arboris TaxID=2682092 RepID=A0A7K1S3W0_9BACT|nr:CocE/NonD family hydrolase [Spirosoma arboris]MVM28507.1 CocE/NonD family hydrolase [Spirosoma arboris]